MCSIYKLVIAVTIFSYTIHPVLSQDRDSNHEIRANLLYPAYGIADIHYEYHSGSKFTVGISFAKRLKKEDNYNEYGSSISLFSRYHPGNRNGKGFFIEGHFSIQKKKNPFDRTLFHFGPSIGYKHYFHNRYHAELLLGMGIQMKNEGGSELSDFFFPRTGLLIGTGF